MRHGRLPALWFGGIAVALVALAGAPPGVAQTVDTRALFDRIERLQTELTTLQRYVYRGEKPSASAAAPVSAAPPPNVAARLQLRITQLEGEIQRLTGQNEELNHRLGRIEETLKKLSTDVEFRLGRIERGSPGLAAAQQPDPPGGRAPLAAAPPRSPAAAAPQAVPGAEMGVRPLGALRAAPPPATAGPSTPAARSTAAVPPAAADPSAPGPTLTPQQQYDQAHALIIRDHDYAQAERVLRKFIDSNPKHDLLPNAHYWLGRTYFVRNDFEQAAFAFAEGFQRFPKAEKAPANLLNLGMSLARLGKTREACTTYSRLLKNYPDSEDAVKRRVARETARAKCR